MGRHPSFVGSARSWLVLLVMLAASGCGSPKGDVSGTVTYQGKLLPIGTVTFMDANKEVLGASPITEGKYSIAKIPVGPVKVLVSTPRRVASKARHPSLKAQVLAKAKGKSLPMDNSEDPSLSEGRASPVVIIPDKYGSPDHSDLTYTVTPGENKFDIELR